jgi:diacylglycerol kinase (ATP)
VRTRSLLYSFNYAIEGIVYALRTQRNMRLHVIAAAVVLSAALFFRIGGLELLALLFAITFVLVTELVNTAVEAAIDVATNRFDPMAKVSKDVAAGAVFIASLNAIAVGYLVFFRRLTHITETLLTRVRQAPAHLTAIAIALTLLGVLVVKAYNREGSFLSGGWPSGHTAAAFAAATATGYVTQSAQATIFALFIAALVLQSRVESGIHTIPQTMLGAILGFLVTTAVFQLFWL